MDNTRNNNIRRSNSVAMQNGRLKSKLMPIYIVKQDSNGNALGRRKINFQINYGYTYHISYKYFTPKGYHLAKNSTSKVTCKYGENGLNVNSITFIYTKDSAKPQPQAKPILVNLISIDNNQKIQTGSASGKYGQMVNVLDQITVPSGYKLCKNQRVTFKISNLNQSIDLMVKRAPVKPAQSTRPIHNVTHSNVNQQPSHHDNHNSSVKRPNETLVHSNGALHTNIEQSIKSLESNLQKYDCDLAVQLVHEVLNHDLDFFKKVITRIFTKMKYKDINNLKTHPQDNRISGVVKKYLYNNNHVNFTFVRARKYDIRHQVTISEVRDFVTSVADHNSSKGVFITTSRFSSDARKEAERHSIILIDDMKLAKLMIQYDVGVKSQRIFRIVNIDKDFFN